MEDSSLWRSAGELIKLYDEDACLIAPRRADALLENGDVEGIHTWKRIANMLGPLRNRDRKPDCTAH